MTGGIKGRKEVTKKKKGGGEAIHFCWVLSGYNAARSVCLTLQGVKTEFRTGNEADLKEDTLHKKVLRHFWVIFFCPTLLVVALFVFRGRFFISRVLNIVGAEGIVFSPLSPGVTCDSSAMARKCCVITCNPS